MWLLIYCPTLLSTVETDLCWVTLHFNHHTLSVTGINRELRFFLILLCFLVSKIGTHLFGWILDFGEAQDKVVEG